MQPRWTRPAGRGNGIADLARVLGLLAVLGYTVELQAWERPAPQADEPKMPVTLLGCNYRNPARPVPEIDRSNPYIDEPEVGNANMMYAESGATSPHQETGGPVANEPLPHIASPSGPPPPEGGQPLAHAFAVVQEGLRAMQALQQQTAAAHERFLQTQEQAHKTFQMVLDSQQRLVAGVLGQPVAPLPPLAAAPPPPPAPVVTPPPASTDGNGESGETEQALLKIVSQINGLSARSGAPGHAPRARARDRFGPPLGDCQRVARGRSALDGAAGWLLGAPGYAARSVARRRAAGSGGCGSRRKGSGRKRRRCREGRAGKKPSSWETSPTSCWRASRS